MNNQQNKTNRSLLDQERNQSNASYNQFNNQANSGFGNAVSYDTGLRDDIRSRYTNNNGFMSTKPNQSGWFDLPPEGSSGSSGSSGGGNAAGGDFSGAKSGYQRFADTGGRENFADAEGSYKNFINNGGIGESEANALRARATSAVPSFFNAYKNNAQRRSNVQGGYSPGFDSQMQELGRESARQGFNASRQVEGDIADKRQQGREFGTTGMYNIGGNTNSNMLSGFGGLKSIGDSEQQNNQFNAGLGESRASRNQQMQLALQQMYQQGGETSAAGLQNLRNSSSGDVGQYGNFALGGMNARSGNALNNINSRAAIRDRSWMDLVPGALSAGGAALSGFGAMGNTGIAGRRGWTPAARGTY